LFLFSFADSSSQVSQYAKDISHDLINDGLYTVKGFPEIMTNTFTMPFSREVRTGSAIAFSLLGVGLTLDQKIFEMSVKKDWWPTKRYGYSEPRKLPVLLPVTSNLEWYESHHIAFAEYGYAFGLLTRNSRLRRLCLDLMQTTAYSFIITRGLKIIAGRKRPGQGDSWDWGNLNFNILSGTSSFPFFHATFYTSYWTVFMGRLGLGWRGPFISAAILFITTEDADTHWFTDAVGGTILGYWIGRAILRKSDNSQNNSSGTTFSVTPLYKGFCFHVVRTF
jgi:hypothetical protein